MSDLTIQAKDGGTFSAYLATPASGSGPGILLIQEIFGVNQTMRDTADSLAADGYTVLCPDLFWRQEPGVQLSDQSEDGWARAMQLFEGFRADPAIDDLNATLDALRGLDACAGKVGCVGFCLGGLLAYLMACRSDVDASVGYYGVAIHEFLGEAANIKKPLLLHVACEDGFVPFELQEAMHEGLDPNPLVTLYDYADRDHAFAREGGEHYHKADAALARKRTLAFFSETLEA